MANGDPLRAGQGLDAEDTTVLDARPFPGVGPALLVRNRVFRIGAPTIPTPWPTGFIGVQGEGTTGVLGASYNSLGPGVAGIGRAPGATGVFGSGGSTAVWGNGIPSVQAGTTSFSPGADIGVMGDAVANAGVFGYSWFGAGVLGRNQEGGQPGVRGEGTTSAGVEGVSDTAGVFGESVGGIGVGGRSRKDAGVAGSSSDGPGVRGFSGHAIGVQGSSEGETGVEGVGPKTGVHGSSQKGQGVVGRSQADVGVLAISGNVALRAIGSRLAGDFHGDVVVRGRLLVRGAKSAVVPVPGGGLAQLYCVEAPEPWFEDLGEARIDGDGAEVVLDPTFVATIRGDYQVQLTAYAPGVLWVARRSRDRFQVRFAPIAGVRAPRQIAFGWRVVARRGDIKAQRFAQVVLPDAGAPAPAPARPIGDSGQRASAPVAIAPLVSNPFGEAFTTPGKRKSDRATKKR